MDCIVQIMTCTVGTFLNLTPWHDGLWSEETKFHKFSALYGTE
jgi:hypothetical protein